VPQITKSYYKDHEGVVAEGVKRREKIYEIEMSLVVVERQTATSMTGHQPVESFRGWLQQPETSDGRQILDDVPVCVAGTMLMNADGSDQAGRQHEPTDQGMAGPDHATFETP